MAAHAYWRLFIAETNGSTGIFVSELKMAETPGGPTVCVGGTASASSFFSTYTPDKAFDASNTLANSWQSLASFGVNSPQNAWLQYHFGGTPRDIVEISISYAADIPSLANAPKAFSLYYSDDNKTWVRQRSWSDQVFAYGETKTYDTTPLPSGLITNKLVLDYSLKDIQAALPQVWFASSLRSPNFSPERNCTRPLRFTPFSGNKRIAGSTTSLGIPLARRVDLVDQRSSQLIERIYTPPTGEFEFSEIADGAYSLIGVDNTGEQNSVIFAHVTPVP